MRLWNIEHVEVVVLGLQFRSARRIKPHTSEDFFRLTNKFVHGMQMPPLFTGQIKRDIQKVRLRQ